MRLNTSDAFLESFLHEEYTILGYKLHPFCLDDWIILDALRSPLIYGGPVSMMDIHLAVTACSVGSVSEFYKVTRKPSLWRRVFTRLISKVKVTPVLAQFNRYMEDHLPIFPLLKPPGASSTKCPGVFVCAARLVRAGEGRANVRRMPLGEVLAWSMAIGESEGNPSSTLLTDMDLQILSEMADAGIDVGL